MLMLYDFKNDKIIFGDYLRYQLTTGFHLDVLVLFLWIVTNFSLLVKNVDETQDIMDGFVTSGMKEKLKEDKQLEHYEKLQLREFQIGFPRLENKRVLANEDRPPIMKRQKSN